MIKHKLTLKNRNNSSQAHQPQRENDNLIQGATLAYPGQTCLLGENSLASKRQLCLVYSKIIVSESALSGKLFFTKSSFPTPFLQPKPRRGFLFSWAHDNLTQEFWRIAPRKNTLFFIVLPNFFIYPKRWGLQEISSLKKQANSIALGIMLHEREILRIHEVSQTRVNGVKG